MKTRNAAAFMLGLTMKKIPFAIPVLVLLALAGACAGDGNEIQESPCEWGDNRVGCEQEKVQCADPRNCY